MDLGADVCTVRRPACLVCPVAIDCVARIEDRIDELPGRRVRATGKRKRIAMLVVLSRGEVLLEKRPSPGIWGGLWSLPEAESLSEADSAAQHARVLAAEWGIEAASIEPLEPFEHAFTHFTLVVAPWRVRVRKVLPMASQKSTTWLALSELSGAALPSPVRKLLQKL